MPGVWEVRLTDIEDTRTFDWKASESGTPVPPTRVRLTISALSSGAAASTLALAAGDQSGQSASQQARESGGGATTDLTLVSRMADFTGKASSYSLGSARIERPTQVYGMVAVTDTTAKHEQGASWTVRRNEWIASVPAGRTPYAAALLEGQVTAAQPFTVMLVPIARDNRLTRR